MLCYGVVLDHQLELFKKEGIDVIEEGYLVVNRILLSHYPMQETPYDGKKVREFKNHLRRVFNQEECWFHFFGHTHSRPSPYSIGMNVCVNLNNYFPVWVINLLD